MVADARRRGQRRAVRPAGEDAPHPAEAGYESGSDRGGYSVLGGNGADGNADSPPPNNVERQVLWLAANEPDGVWPEIGPELFHHPLYRGVFEALLEYPDMDTLLAEAEPGVIALMRELVVDEDEELRTSSHRQDVVMAILLYESAQRELAYLERQARAGSADDDLLRRVASLKTTMDQLRESEWDAGQARALLKLLRPGA